MLTEVTIRPLNNADVTATAQLIVHTLKNSLIQKLGVTFTQKYFLPAAMQNPGLYSFVCEHKNKVVGYLLFAKNQKSMQQLGRSILPGILRYTVLKYWRHPSLCIDLLASFYNSIKVQKAYLNKIDNAIYLVYFAIDETMQGIGIGTHALKKCFKILSPTSCIVETLEPRAVKFYEKQHFILIGCRRRLMTSYPLLFKDLENGEYLT